MRFEFDSIHELVTEASKIMHMDTSHSAVHGKLQDHLSTQHRMAHPDDYHNSPQVQDVFGDHEGGEVVYSNGYRSDAKHTKASYKKSGDGYELSKHKNVKRSYVETPEEDQGDKIPRRESALVTKDGELVELITIQESAFDKDGKGMVKMISPGSGSMGHYKTSTLKKLAESGSFDGDIQMFLDHPTDDERVRSGTGSVSKLAAMMKGKAVYQENGKEGPGIYKPAVAYPDTKDFLNSRSKDIGVSVALGVDRASVSRRPKMDGVPVLEAEDVKKAISCDFVSLAGAGGKLVTIFESFRERQPRSPETQQRSNMEIDEKTLKTLQEAAAVVPGLLTRLDRVEEDNERYRARDIITESLSLSGLPARGQNRVMSLVLNSNLPKKDGKLDTTVLQESAKKAIEEEIAYIRESGGRVVTNPVKGVGGSPSADATEDPTGVLTEAGKSLDDALASISGFGRGSK